MQAVIFHDKAQEPIVRTILCLKADGLIPSLELQNAEQLLAAGPKALDGYYCVNRFFPGSTFGLDRLTEIQEAYLSLEQRLIKARCDVKPSDYGLAGRVMPLFLQWEYVRNLSGVRVPRYYFPYQEATFPAAAAVRGSSTSYYQWRPSDSDELSFRGLIYERPEGVPVVALKFGSMLRLIDLEIGQDYGGPLAHEIFRIQENIAATFGHFFSESLFFLNSDEISFAMYHPAMHIGSRWADFDSNVLRSLEGLIKELHDV